MKKALALLLVPAILLAVSSCRKDGHAYTLPDDSSGTVIPNPPSHVKKIDFGKSNLGDLAAQQGIKLGAAFTYWEYRSNPQVAQILSREFKAVTFGNEMKHDAIVQPDGSMNFEIADQMAAWAKEAGTELFGHVLGWHSQQQTAYLSTLATPEAIDKAFRSYVFGMVEHFDVYAWDVVNETFSDGTNGAFRTQFTTPQAQHVFVWGSSYNSTQEWVDKAFSYATEACSKYGKKPILYINDYNLETDPGKRRALCEYAKDNPQVTGVASQMHLDMAIPELKAKIEDSLKELTATGKMVRISELDLQNKDESAQAEMIRYIFQKYLEIVPPQQRGGITFWGINDKDSWVGEQNAPLLWKGIKYEKKAAYEALYVYLCELNGIDPYME